MAKILTGVGHSSLSGSVAGTTFKHSAGRLVLASKKLRSAGRSPLQLVTRGRFCRVTTRWRALTPAQREAFNHRAALVTLYNSLGQPFRPSGFQLYVRTVMDRLAAGMTVGTEVPPKFVFELPTFTNVAMTVGAGTWNVQLGPVQAGVSGRVLRMSKPLPDTLAFISDQTLRPIISNSSAGVQSIYNAYTNAWYQLGTRQRGMWILAQVNAYAAGGAKSVAVYSYFKIT